MRRTTSMLRRAGDADPRCPSSLAGLMRGRSSASCLACRRLRIKRVLSGRRDAGLRSSSCCGSLQRKVGWFTNNSASGVITAQKVVILGYRPSIRRCGKVHARPFAIVDRCSRWLAKNMAAQRDVGRKFMAVRDMDLAAEVIGIRMMQHQAAGLCDQLVLLRRRGRAVSHIAYLGTVEPEAFNLDLSFRILFMVIIGGVGSILGSFMGAAFIVLLPMLSQQHRRVSWIEQPARLHACRRRASCPTSKLIVFGALIIFFLIVEPHGLARLVADRQGKAEAMAVPTLMLRCR